MFSRRKRELTIGVSIQQERNPDVSQSRMSSWGGRPVVMNIGNKLVDSYIVYPHRDSYISGSTAEHTDVTKACALHTLGDGATSEVTIPDHPAGYILENQIRIHGGQGEGLRAVSKGVAEAEEVSGPITITCKDSQGITCPKAKTCEYVADYADKRFHVVTGVATVAINHYEPKEG